MIRRPRSLFWTFAGAFLLVLVAAALLQAVIILAVVKPITLRWMEDRADLVAREAAETLAALPAPLAREDIAGVLQTLSNPPDLHLFFRFDDGRFVSGRPRTPRDVDGPRGHERPQSPDRPERPPGGKPGAALDPLEQPDPGDGRMMRFLENSKHRPPPDLQAMVRRPVTLASAEAGEVVAVIFSSRFSFPRGGPGGPLLLFLPIAVLVAGGGGLILFRSFLRRLRALEDLTTRVTEGDLDARVKDLGTDEIGRLGGRLNRMTEAIGEAQGRIEQNDRQRRQLFADITHDLATPLTSIRGYAETLLNPEVSVSEDERRTYLQAVLEESQRLDLLIKDLFELARLEAEAVSLAREPLDWAALCRNTAARFAARFRDAGLDLAWEDSAAEAWVYADGHRLEQLLENLLTNALRYVPTGGQVRLKMAPAADGRAFRLSVSDDGPGFAAEDLPHVFDRFYRGDSARTGTGGTGLGLAIVQEIALRHDGSIRAENRSPSGAAILVELPAHPSGA